MGLKPSDFMCLPLTTTEHEKLHRIGEKTFWRDLGLDPSELITCEILVYMATIKVDYPSLANFISRWHAGEPSHRLL